MKTILSLRLALAGACLLPAVPWARAGELGVAYNRLTVDARFAFNVKASIQNFAPPLSSGPNYDDGFVRPDISGGAGGQTWNWGYSQNNQVVGKSLELHSMSSPRDGQLDSFKDDPHAGFEIVYGRVLGRLPLSAKTKLTWGVEGGFSSLDLTMSRQNTVGGLSPRRTDSYDLGAITPPLAPYAGTFNGPGPLIAANSSSTSTTMVPASSAMSASLDGLVYGLKAGPWIEVPVFKRCTFVLSGGLAAVNAGLDFSYTETVTILDPTANGTPPPPRAEKISQSKWMIGAYGNCAVSVALTDSTSLFVGGQFQHLGNLAATGAAKAAMINLGQTLEGVAGLRFSF